MKKLMLSTLIVIFCICLTPIQGLTCTTFVLDNNGQPIYGKNFDDPPLSAYMIVNKRGVAKTTSYSPATWTSKFGSVTFNFLTRELPFDGINEAGLFISSMALDHTEYPQDDSRPVLNVSQWIQYQLDNFSTVDEVIASDKDVRPRDSSGGGGHWLVSDSQGNSAIIEWLDGKMVCHTGQSMPVKVLVGPSGTYDNSIEYLTRYNGYGGILPIALSKVLIRLRGLTPRNNSLPRFAWAAHLLQGKNASTASVQDAFDILSAVAEPKISMAPTLCSFVYDMPNRTVYFRTLYNNKIRSFNLSLFDFSCSTPVKALDVNAKISGDVTGTFVDYTEEMGRELLKKNAPSLSEDEVDFIVTYPDKYTHCTE